MIISKSFISPNAKKCLSTNPLAKQAYDEIISSIELNITYGSDHFIINNSAKNCNGVVPIKEGIYERLECYYNWFREKPLTYLKETAQKGGPIDAYKEFTNNDSIFKVGLEFETGNISSAHRSMNKLCLGINASEINLGVIILPIQTMAYYLTDRVSNYEELEPYFLLLNNYPFIVIGFDADEYKSDAPLLAKGKDGMSTRAKHLWKQKRD